MSTRIGWPEVLSQWELLRRKYLALKEDVDVALGAFASSAGYLYESRIKGRESYLHKLETGRFADFRLEDFLAASLIVPSTGSVAQCASTLPVRLVVVERRDASTRSQEPEVFNFNDTILICRLAPPEGAEVKPGNIYDLRFELQIKTLLQFAWGRLTHPLAYKAPTVDWRRHRLAAQMRAVAEQADLIYGQFETLSAAIAEATSPRIAERVVFKAAIDRWLERGLVPPEHAPKDMATLASGLVSVCSMMHIKPDATCAAVEKYLEESGYPLSLTLSQVVIGVVITRKWGQVSERELRQRKCHFFLTREMGETFPKVREVPDALAVRFDLDD